MSKSKLKKNPKKKVKNKLEKLSDSDMGLTGYEQQRAKKAVRDGINLLRRRWNIETGAMPIRQKLKKKSEAEFHPQYVGWLEENFIVQDVVIKMAGLHNDEVKKMLKKAGLFHAKAPN